MNIPGWALFLFAFFGMGFVLLGPEAPIVNVLILCGVILALAGFVAFAGQFFMWLAGGAIDALVKADNASKSEPAYKDYPPNRKVKRGHFEGSRFVVDEYQEG